jgi:hypothetical protein
MVAATLIEVKIERRFWYGGRSGWYGTNPSNQIKEYNTKKGVIYNCPCSTYYTHDIVSKVYWGLPKKKVAMMKCEKIQFFCSQKIYKTPDHFRNDEKSHYLFNKKLPLLPNGKSIP